MIFHRVLPWESRRVKIFIDETPMAAYNVTADRDMLYTCETELTFKRYVLSPDTRAAFLGGFL